jgi:lycopene beta-cyclase
MWFGEGRSVAMLRTKHTVERRSSPAFAGAQPICKSLSYRSSPRYGGDVTDRKCDVAILGGGLSGCLIALAFAARRPELDVRLFDPGERLGGNHVWSFFDSDVAGADRWLVEPLIGHSWASYDIAFPAHRRTLDARYNSITSEQLDAVVRERLPDDRIIRGAVSSAQGTRFYSEDGRNSGQNWQATQIIDTRGPGNLTTLELGWQKFVGLEVHVPGGHGLMRPIVMDATVPQIDGYRFVYCLPFDAEHVFIEDTYYSDTPDLDVPAIRERIIAYAAARGWQTNGGGREETGVLPVAISGDFDAYWASTGTDTQKAGLRAGLFHPTTGYSLPDAVRLAAALAETPALDTRSYAAARWKEGGFYRMLDAMLFRAAEPEQRYKVLQRFYSLSPSLIGRFYAGRSTWFDKLRILSGKPPVPIGHAMKAIMGRTK